jgi:hypothetical protein
MDDSSGVPTRSIIKKYDEIKGNFFIGNYYGQEAVDNDDGSAYLLCRISLRIHPRPSLPETDCDLTYVSSDTQARHSNCLIGVGTTTHITIFLRTRGRV